MKPVPPGAFTTRAELRQAGARGAAAVFSRQAARQPHEFLGRYVLVLVLLAVSFNLLAMRYLWESDYISYIAARFDETKRIVREIPVTNRVSDDVIAAYEQLGYMNAQLGGEVSPVPNPYFEHKLINSAAQRPINAICCRFSGRRWKTILRTNSRMTFRRPIRTSTAR